MASNTNGSAEPEDPEERRKRFAAAEAITLLSSRAFRSHISALPVNTITQSRSRTVRKKQQQQLPPIDYPVPVTVTDDSAMPTVVSEVSKRQMTKGGLYDEVPSKSSQPIPGCDLVMVENSIPIAVMSREELATKRPTKTTSPRHLPPKKRKIHVSPTRSDIKRPAPPKTLALAPVSPSLPKAPLDLSPAVTPEFTPDMAVKYVSNQLDMQLSAIDKRAREINKNRSGSLTSPLASPTKSQESNGFRSHQVLRRSQSLTTPISTKFSFPVDGRSEEIVPGSEQAKKLTETLRARMMKKDEDGDIALHIAVVHGNVPLVRVLISLMKSDNFTLDNTNNMKQTALHLSILTEDMDVVRMLLEGGADPNLGDRRGDNCFHLAVRKQNLDIMRLLVEESKTSPDFQMWNNEGYTPLHIAAQKRFVLGLKFLVSKGADVNAKDGKSGRTSLFHAVEKGDYEICKHLIKLGASPEIANYAGFTPFAATSKSSPLCVLLSSYLPGKRATIKPDQIQGQEFPQLQIKQIATPHEVIYRVNAEAADTTMKESCEPLKSSGDEQNSTPTSSDPEQANIRREIMYPEAFKRAKSKKPNKPLLKRSESMPAQLSSSTDEKSSKSPEQSYSPVSDISEKNENPPQSLTRFDSPSRIIERAKMQKRGFPSPLSLEIPSSTDMGRYIPAYPPVMSHNGQFVPIMTQDARFVPISYGMHPYAMYAPVYLPQRMMNPLQSPNKPQDFSAVPRGFVAAKSREKERDLEDKRNSELLEERDRVAAMGRDDWTGKTRGSGAANERDSSAAKPRDFGAAILHSVAVDEYTVVKQQDFKISNSPIENMDSPVKLDSVSSVKTEPLYDNPDSVVKSEPDIDSKLEIIIPESTCENTSDSTCENTITTTETSNPDPDSSCPDLHTFSSKPNSPEKSPSPEMMESVPEIQLESCTIDKKDLFSRIRSKVKSRLSPQSSLKDGDHAKLSRSSSLGAIPVERLNSEELPSVLQDVK